MAFPTFLCFAVRKHKGQLEFKQFNNFESRNQSNIRLITLADQKYNFKDFSWTLISTDDLYYGNSYNGLRCFSPVTNTTDFSHCCPDFMFDHYTHCQIGDYEEVTEELIELGKQKPETNMLGWRGAKTHPLRQIIVDLNDKKDYDTEFIVWDRTNPNKLTCSNHVSLQDHVRKWRYLIDIEGNTYSIRTKYFFFTRRLIFLQEKTHNEWFFEHLKPWEHYVPIKRDLSDLKEKFEHIRQNEILEEQIVENAFNFAINNLTREHALARWNHLLKV